MARIWIFLFLFMGMGMACSGQAVAQSRCNIDRIRTQLQTSDTFPDLRGCRPENVRPLLQNHDYGFQVERSVESRTYREGRIVSQRLDDGYVFVDVSSGPGPERNREIVTGIVGGLFEVISNLPTQPPPTPEPIPERPPPVQDLRPRDVTIPAAPPAVETPPPVQAPVTQRILQPEPTPAPVEPSPAGDQRVTQVLERPSDPAPAPQPTETPPTPTTDPETLQNGPDPRPPPPPPIVEPPAPSHFIIEGHPSVSEGDELLLTIRREGRDGLSHRLMLGYSDPSLLVGPPPSFAYGAERPDTVTLRLRTAVTEGDGDHQLVVSLSSTDSAEVKQQDSATALILHRTSWWDELLQALASLPVWALVVAGGAAAAGLGLYLMPRATCSIEGGSLGWGARRPRVGWPEVHVEVLMGKPLFSVPSSLPIGRRENVQPSPT